jgi:hypothetical protein
MPRCLFEGEVVVLSRHLEKPLIIDWKDILCGRDGRTCFSSCRRERKFG